MKALGCHVFAGGFTQGVRKVLPVDRQLEVHGLGKDTIEAMGIEFTCCDPEHWPAPDPNTLFMFGNPRCTGFSTVASIYDRGPWSKPTIDIRQFMEYGIKHKIPYLCWESVQQAYTTGYDLVHYLAEEECKPAGYRVAHFFINAGTFGNAQHRKRYFFVAYPADAIINVEIDEYCVPHRLVGDVICTEEFKQYQPDPSRFLKCQGWHADSHWTPPEYLHCVIPDLPAGWDLNKFARVYEGEIGKYSQKFQEQWWARTSSIPFSLHSLMRLDAKKCMPVITGTGQRFIHPIEDRTCTLREVARLMGWDHDIIPTGDAPFAQLGKGIVPCVGEWIAQQVVHSNNGKWDKDWSSKYVKKSAIWDGEIFEHDDRPQEKVLDVTQWCAWRE